METELIVEGRHVPPVVSLPMRDGNRQRAVCGRGERRVVSLPMRDGNVVRDIVHHLTQLLLAYL